ncbi:uncharacterized protein RJT21DRAFT_115661 [Scheffersomyces amazonensis]|uniref:uncharacterized protein n=1 Tax=Scheffersomyces amazonensis TaxID=1078765 RepID=UPI00315DEEB7
MLNDKLQTQLQPLRGSLPQQSQLMIRIVNPYSRTVCSRLIRPMRNYSTTPKNTTKFEPIIESSKEILKKVATEDTKESTIVLKTLRYAGGFSVIVVICSIMWASALEEPRPEIEPTVVLNLRKDVRE